MANSQVVKSRSSSECEAGEVVFAETTLIPDFPHYLGGPDVVLDLYADAGDLPVEFHQHLIKDESLRPFERHEDRRIFPVFHIADILNRYNVHQADVYDRSVDSEALAENFEIYGNDKSKSTLSMLMCYHKRYK